MPKAFNTDMRTLLLINIVASIGIAAHALYVQDASYGVTYRGIERDGIQHFYGIPYGQDTSGQNRFKPPRRYIPAPGSVIDATNPGPACPQPLGKLFAPLGQGNVTDVSEDCLNLNIVRPSFKNIEGHGKLAVMIWIHGGRLNSTDTLNDPADNGQAASGGVRIQNQLSTLMGWSSSLLKVATR